MVAILAANVVVPCTWSLQNLAPVDIDCGCLGWAWMGFKTGYVLGLLVALEPVFLQLKLLPFLRTDNPYRTAEGENLLRCSRNSTRFASCELGTQHPTCRLNL